MPLLECKFWNELFFMCSKRNVLFLKWMHIGIRPFLEFGQNRMCFFGMCPYWTVLIHNVKCLFGMCSKWSVHFLECAKVIYTKYSKHWSYTVAHTIDCVWKNVKSWFKSWVFPFTFQAYTLPNTLNCIVLVYLNFIIEF